MSQKDINLKTKIWLWRYRDAKIDVLRLEMAYRELVESQESAGSIRYDAMPGTGNLPELTGYLITRDECLSKLIRAKKHETDCYREILNAIEQLNEAIERGVMSMRYTQFQCGVRKNEWQEISCALGYSLSAVKQAHGIALQKIAPFCT